MGINPREDKKNDLGIKCPFRFGQELAGFSSDCIQENCALWMFVQRACALNVIARKEKRKFEKYDR